MPEMQKLSKTGALTGTDEDEIATCAPQFGVADMAQLEVARSAIGTAERIGLRFDSMADGRMFSVAQLLRRRYGFQGELWALGAQLLPDQAYHAFRSGFDYIVYSNAHAETAQRVCRPFTQTYQARLQAQAD